MGQSGAPAGLIGGEDRPESPGDERVPPGQRTQTSWPVLHYGPVPKFRPERWDLRVYGATADGSMYRWDFESFQALPRAEVRADFHCVTKFTMLDNVWGGVLASTVLAVAPPAPDVAHVMVWAEYGYCANLRLADLAGEASIFADHRNGEQLTPERGFPLRLIVPHLYAWKGPKWVRAIEYLTEDRRGFWEERGYHNTGDPWGEQRYSYQEQ